MNDPADKLVFADDYELIEYFSRMVRHSQANEATSKRLREAHEYVEANLRVTGWGKNVWHSVLDDAIRMKKLYEPEVKE